MEFWNHNLNPITMLPVPNENPAERNKYSKKGMYATSDEIESMIESRDLIEMLGVSAKKLKALFKSIGDAPRYKGKNSYYSAESVERIKEILNFNS